MRIAPEQVDRLLDWTARLREDATAMPWAKPPPQPDWFDIRDAAEAEEFGRWLASRNAPPVPAGPRCGGCGYREDAAGHRIMCGGAL